MKFERSDLKSNVEVEVNRVGLAVQNADLEHPGTSSAVGHLDEVERLSPGNDLFKSLGFLISKFEPFSKIIDDVSRVSQRSLRLINSR